MTGLSFEQEEELAFILNEADCARAKLNPWETRFLNDFIERYDKFGARVTISPKQWNVLKKILAKVAENNDVSF